MVCISLKFKTLKIINRFFFISRYLLSIVVDTYMEDILCKSARYFQVQPLITFRNILNNIYIA